MRDPKEIHDRVLVKTKILNLGTQELQDIVLINGDLAVTRAREFTVKLVDDYDLLQSVSQLAELDHCELENRRDIACNKEDEDLYIKLRVAITLKNMLEDTYSTHWAKGKKFKTVEMMIRYYEADIRKDMK